MYLEPYLIFVTCTTCGAGVKNSSLVLKYCKLVCFGVKICNFVSFWCQKIWIWCQQNDKYHLCLEPSLEKLGDIPGLDAFGETTDIDDVL